MRRGKVVRSICELLTSSRFHYLNGTAVGCGLGCCFAVSSVRFGAISALWGGSLGKPRWAIGFGLAATRGLVTRPGEFLACGVKLCPSRTSRPGRTRAAKVWAAPRPRSPALRWSHCSQSLLGAQARRECVVMSQTSSRERHAGPGASNRRGLD